MTPSPATTVRFHSLSACSAPNVARLARQSLHDSSYPDLRAIDCDFADGVLTLRGRVSSFHMKQVAQVIAARVAEVECLINQLEVLDVSHLASDHWTGQDSLRSSAAQ
jgi:osmotically-inducible protein OsmY